MTREKTRLNQREWRSVGALCGVFALRMLGIFLILPVLSRFASQLNGATPLLVGLAFGSFPLMQTLLQVPFGWLSDRYGRKPILELALLLFAAGSLWAALSRDIWHLIAALALQGSGAVAAVIIAYVADLTRPEVRTRSMAMVGSSIGLAFGIGFILGPLLAGWMGVPFIFHCIAILALLAVAVVAFLVPAPEVQVHHDEAQLSTGRLKHVLSDKNLWRMNAGIFVLNGTLRGLFLVAPFLLAEVIARQHEWLIYLPTLLVAGLIMVPVIIFAERDGYMKEALYFSLATLGLGLLVFASQEKSIAFYLAGFILYFIGFSILEAIMPSLETRLAPESDRGTAVGLFNMSQYLGAFGGAILGGTFLERSSGTISLKGHYWLLFVILAAFVAAWGVIAWKLPIALGSTRRQAVEQTSPSSGS